MQYKDPEPGGGVGVFELNRLLGRRSGTDRVLRSGRRYSAIINHPPSSNSTLGYRAALLSAHGTGAADSWDRGRFIAFPGGCVFDEIFAYVASFHFDIWNKSTTGIRGKC